MKDAHKFSSTNTRMILQQIWTNVRLKKKNYMRSPSWSILFFYFNILLYRYVTWNLGAIFLESKTENHISITASVTLILWVCEELRRWHGERNTQKTRKHWAYLWMTIIRKQETNVQCPFKGRISSFQFDFLRHFRCHIHCCKYFKGSKKN